MVRRAARIVIGVSLHTPPLVSEETAPDEEHGARIADAGAEADLSRLDPPGERQVHVADLGVDAAGELLARDPGDELEVVVVLQAAEVQVRRAYDRDALVEGCHLQMGEMVLVLVEADAGGEQPWIIVLHGGRRGPSARGSTRRRRGRPTPRSGRSRRAISTTAPAPSPRGPGPLPRAPRPPDRKGRGRGTAPRSSPTRSRRRARRW